MNFRLRHVFLAVLVSMSRDLQANYIPGLSRILNVTCIKGMDFSPCHRCLVSSVGVNRIDLVQDSDSFRLYWIQGRYSDMIRSFITSCSGTRMCRISAESTEAYTVDYSTLFVSQRLATKLKLNMFDESIRVFATSMVFEETIVEAHGRTMKLRHPNHEKTSFKRKGGLEIPLLFGGDFTAIKNTDLDSLSDQQEKTPFVPIQDSEILNSKSGYMMEAQNGQNIPLSLQCMIIPSFLEDAVCRECLAKYSESLGIRTYLLFYRKLTTSAQLCVFRSIYESSEIIRSCEAAFCSEIKQWSLSDCAKVESVVSKLSSLFDNTNNKHNQKNHDHTRDITDKEPKSLKEIKQVLDLIAYKRMARARARSGASFQQFISVTTLQREAFTCIKISSKHNRNFECIGCILENVLGARVAITLSLNSALILTNPSESTKTFEDCKETCNVVKKLNHYDCINYSIQQRVNTELYVKPLETQCNNENSGYCLISFHFVTSGQNCYKRMGEYFSLNSQKPRINILTKTSLLTDTSGLDSDLLSKSIENYRSPRSLKTCIRIQKVPHKLCSEHEAVITAASIQSTEAIAIETFNKEQIPVGVWPPQNHITFSTGGPVDVQMSCLWKTLSDSDTKLTPICTSITLVKYKCGKSKQVECVSCLLQHTEVYFAYNDKSSTSGYVWMRQAPSLILKSCIDYKNCLSLSYNAHRTQVKLPDGVRQLTIEDIRS